MIFRVIANPRLLVRMQATYMSGNDAGTKLQVCELLVSFGWPDNLMENLGGIASARGPEAFMHLASYIISNFGFAPFALTIVR
jgi:hypothetical protein